MFLIIIDSLSPINSPNVYPKFISKVGVKSPRLVGFTTRYLNEPVLLALTSPSTSKEPEIMVTKDDFLGSSEIADKVEQIANERRYDLVWMNKVNTKQSYIRIRRPHVMLGAHIEHLRKNHGFTET